MTLLLRKVQHINAPDNYRVIYEDVEVGSIGLQFGNSSETFWSWAIDTVLAPDPEIATRGTGQNREDCMVQFKEAWRKFSRNPERLAEFMDTKRYLQKKWRRD